ncbi:MAG: hypothetical protein UHU19_01320, partial [Lachnospiraceae bacterium]|nr:hypothetical protein [Lachnospiraceae bacterium]
LLCSLWQNQTQRKRKGSFSIFQDCFFVYAAIDCSLKKFHVLDKLEVNKIAARWPAKAVAQFFYFFKKGSDRIVPR